MRVDVMRHVRCVIRNSFYKETLSVITFPLDLANGVFMNGFMKYYKKVKTDMASIYKIDKHFIRSKFSKFDSPSKNISVSLPSKLSIEFPYDVTKYELKIILAQLEVLKMSSNPHRAKIER